MADELTPVTAAPARAASASVRSAVAANQHPLPASGNRALPGGEELPAPPPPRPTVDVEKTAARLNEIMTSKQRSLRFRVDEGSGRTVITVINKTTHEVIRQIPPEELLAVADQLGDLGALIDVRI